MRNLFLMLLFANILFFAWQHWVHEPDAGVTIVERAELGDPIALAGREVSETPQTDTVAVDTAPEAPAKTLSSAVGRACISVGPFPKVDTANDELATLLNDGYAVAQRATQGQVFQGHWVYVDNIPSRGQARTLLQKLQDGGLKDAILMAGAPGEDVISLGMFSALSGAERIELQAKGIGVEAQMTGRSKEATVFWLDIKLQDGQAGSALVDSYGNDKVLRGNAAICPPNR
ncbi:MAG: hypothetical protein AB8F65_04195 [Woeseiaceae bacterium]